MTKNTNDTWQFRVVIGLLIIVAIADFIFFHGLGKQHFEGYDEWAGSRPQSHLLPQVDSPTEVASVTRPVLNEDGWYYVNVSYYSWATLHEEGKIALVGGGSNTLDTEVWNYENSSWEKKIWSDSGYIEVERAYVEDIDYNHGVSHQDSRPLMMRVRTFADEARMNLSLYTDGDWKTHAAIEESDWMYINYTLPVPGSNLSWKNVSDMYVPPHVVISVWNWTNQSWSEPFNITGDNANDEGRILMARFAPVPTMSWNDVYEDYLVWNESV